MDTVVIPLAIGSYLLGAIPSAYLAVRWTKGIDIRRQGTGNVGAANVLRNASKWLAIPVALFDIGKGAACVWVAQLLDLGAAEQVTVGILAVVGHNWPIYLRFKGGRGVFTTLGMLTALSPKLGLIILVMPYLFAPIKQVAFGVFLGFATMPFLAYFAAEPLDIVERGMVTVGVALVASMGLARRLLVRRSDLSRAVPLPRLIFNRLLFDRDIMDQDAWINRQPMVDPDS